MSDEAWASEFCNQEEKRMMMERIHQLESFAIDVRDNWDCDTGANGTHPQYCRRCEAEKLLQKETK